MEIKNRVFFVLGIIAAILYAILLSMVLMSKFILKNIFFLARKTCTITAKNFNLSKTKKIDKHNSG